MGANLADKQAVGAFCVTEKLTYSKSTIWKVTLLLNCQTRTATHRQQIGLLGIMIIISRLVCMCEECKQGQAPDSGASKHR